MQQKQNPKIDFANLDLNLLKVFDILMQERNLTRAAERLNKSTGATSNALKRLREGWPTAASGDPRAKTMELNEVTPRKDSVG